MRVLIIEDEIDVQLFLKSQLEEKCFAVDVATDGDMGIRLATTNQYDLILLDYSLPLKNGFEVCIELRKVNNHTRIIMISGTREIPHKIEGLNLGIDDYVTKPYFFDELYARIQAVLRRSHTQQHAILQFDDLVLDINTQKVVRGKTTIYLTRKEFSLLEYLLRNPGNVVSRRTIMEHIWDINLDPFSNTIETHVLNLRKKIDRLSTQKLIHSIPGRGYKIDFAR